MEIARKVFNLLAEQGVSIHYGRLITSKVNVLISRAESNLKLERISVENEVTKTLNFTKDDFLGTDKPYRLVAENAKTSLEEEQLIESMRQYALSKGVMNFAKLYSCYKQDCLLKSGERVRGAK